VWGVKGQAEEMQGLVVMLQLPAWQQRLLGMGVEEKKLLPNLKIQRICGPQTRV
jgi:hypothetical protein